MTKEELEKEAEEFVCSKKSFWKQGRTCVESVRQAYIASGEPREKRIAELEKHNTKLQQACHKWFMRWRETKKDAIYFDSGLQKQIEATLKLHKEYEELKERIKSEHEIEARRNNSLISQLTKAKELLNEFMRISKASDEDFEHDYSELIAEAEQFLKECE